VPSRAPRRKGFVIDVVVDRAFLWEQMSIIDFDQLAMYHHCRLYQQALQLTRNRDKAQDLTQDTFERCLRRLPTGVPAEKVLSWMLVVMRHLFLDEIRSRACRRQVVLDVENCPDVEPDSVEDPPNWQAIPVKAVRQAVRALPDTLRRPYELHVFVNLRYREVGAVLHLPVKTVGTRIHRARRRLRDLLEPLIPLPPAAVPAPQTVGVD
jgi:RNA polymerase sigma-70 factor (ECF subfamily)